MNPFKSRKALIAWLATSIATGIVTWAESHGWVPLDKRTEILETLIQCITLIWSLLGFSIAHEDKGAKEGVPPPVQLAASPAWVADVVRQHLPKAPVALLAFFLGFGAVQAKPLPLIDLGTLQPGPTGRQADRDSSWPSGWTLEHLILVPVVREDATGGIYMLDPEALLHGQAEAHRWLLALDGIVTDKATAKKLVSRYAKDRARELAVAAAAEVAGRLPASLGGLAPDLVRDALRGLMRGRR